MKQEQVFGGTDTADGDDRGALGIGGGQLQVNPLDAILDEIDVTLEENAEQFVQGFVQKGGQ